MYDRVNWDYLERVSVVMGFQPSLINLMMKCIKLASFSVLINGIPKGFIKPGRGLT